MKNILDAHRELVVLLANNNELQKIFTKIAVQLIAADVMPIKDQKSPTELLKDASAILKNVKIILNTEDLKEAIATWAGRKITWRIEKI